MTPRPLTDEEIEAIRRFDGMRREGAAGGAALAAELDAWAINPESGRGMTHDEREQRRAKLGGLFEPDHKPGARSRSDLVDFWVVRVADQEGTDADTLLGEAAAYSGYKTTTAYNYLTDERARRKKALRKALLARVTEERGDELLREVGTDLDTLAREIPPPLTDFQRLPRPEVDFDFLGAAEGGRNKVVTGRNTTQAESEVNRANLPALG
jgi:hypothetical protein